MTFQSISEFGSPVVTNHVVRQSLKRKQGIVLVGVQILLSVLVYVILILQSQGVDGELVPLLLFGQERVFQTAIVFKPVVIQTINQISGSKQMRVKICGCHSSQFEPYFLHSIVADKGIYRTNVKRSPFFLDRNKPREQQIDELLCPVVNGNITQLCKHLVDRFCLSSAIVFIGFTVFSPELIVSSIRFGRFYYRLLMSEGFPVNIVIEFIVRIRNLATSINTVNKVIQLEFGCNALVCEQTGVYAVSGKFLLQVHVFHKVQVYVIRNIHLDPFYKMRGIDSNIKVSGKAERLKVVGYKCQVNALFAINHQGVLKKIFVICGGVIGKRAYKLIAHNEYLLVEKVNITQGGLK